MAAADLLAIGRIAGAQGRPGAYTVTVRGDGLADLKAPFTCLLHRAAYRGVDLSQILASVYPRPRDDGEYWPATVSSVAPVRSGKTIVRLKLPDELAGQDIKGLWICIREEQLLTRSEGVYLFQLLGLPVYADPAGEPVARVKDFLETGAHGLLVLERLDGDGEALLPLVEEHATLDLGAGRVIAPRYYDLIQALEP